MNNSTGRRLKTVNTMMDIVETIQKLEGARVSEIANDLNFAPSTVHGYMSTLADRGYLVKEGDVYYVGLRFLNLGGHAATRKRAYKIAKEKVSQLAEVTGERAQFIIEENGRGTYIHTSVGDNAVQVDAQVGKYIYLHSSAAGKSILASHTNEYVIEIIDKWGLPPSTNSTITNQDELLNELKQISERGYAVNDHESIDGLRAIGAPVKGKDGQIVGGVSISGPSNRMKGDRFKQEIPELLLGAINELELNIKYN